MEDMNILILKFAIAIASITLFSLGMLTVFKFLEDLAK